MCGIVGYLDKTGQHSSKLGSALLQMLNALGRRGPDSAGVALYTPRDDEAHLLRVKLGNQGDFAARAAEVARRVGCTKVNIDTDLRLAMTAAIRKAFADNPKEFDPRKYLGPARAKVKELVRHKVRTVLCCAGHAFD